MRVKVEGATSTYSFESFEFVRGSRVKKNGVAGEGRLISWDSKTDPNVLVVAWKGYGENPGSRYSGLYSYYPATTAVYVYDHTDKFGRRRYVEMHEWDTRAPK